MFRLFMQNSMFPPVKSYTYNVTDTLSQSDITLMCVNFGKITKLYST